MNERDLPLPLSGSDKEVSFYEGQDCPELLDETIEDGYRLLPITPEPPNILLSGEELVSAQDDLDELEAKRVAESETLKDKLYITVSRHEVLTELLRLYADDQVFSKKIVPTFEGENSSGDGVLCELYSLFWEDFLRERENYNRARTVAVAPNSP